MYFLYISNRSLPNVSSVFFFFLFSVLLASPIKNMRGKMKVMPGFSSDQYVFPYLSHNDYTSFNHYIMSQILTFQFQTKVIITYVWTDKCLYYGINNIKKSLNGRFLAGRGVLSKHLLDYSRSITERRRNEKSYFYMNKRNVYEKRYIHRVITFDSRLESLLEFATKWFA